jgi:exosome complex RNA-binding protein Csl4
MSENAIFPGDKIASIEEYEAGNNALLLTMEIW